MKILNAISAGFLAGGMVLGQAQAIPLADVKLQYMDNHNGTYTYFLKLDNAGPISAGVTTSPDHAITVWNGGVPATYPAGSKSLDDDENVVYFGIDLGIDDAAITDILNGGTSFRGSVEQGWADTNSNGIPNQVVAWHLPFYGWTLNDTLKPGNGATVSFTLNRELKRVQFWVGGSDDAVIWVDSHVMEEDQYGIYDATDGAYLATLFYRNLAVTQSRGKKVCTGTGAAKSCVLW